MKKISIFMSIVITIIFIGMPFNVSAKTLRNLTTELNQLEADLNKSKQEKVLTEDQMDNIRGNINAINGEINQIHVDIKNINDSITLLNDSIAQKDQEIKDIMNFVQVSNGESAYLEYAFGAKSFTDFIYRVAISEQLASYNSNLITDYNASIVKNNSKKDELATRTTGLINKQNQLDIEVKKLGSKLSGIQDLSISLAEEIKLQREAIALYQQLGCNLDEDIKTCGREKLPSGTAFFRPLGDGHVTSNYGNRCFQLGGRWVCDFHNGIDFSTSGGNVPIYAAGNGMVIAISKYNRCGGNMVYVHHQINGQFYTTLYAHLRTINVSPKQAVTRSTVIGIMGGDSSTWSYDKCSSGSHLHFQIATGLYLKDYYSWSTFSSRSFNARNIINIPSGSNFFYDRITKY